jgi:predicted permease
MFRRIRFWLRLRREEEDLAEEIEFHRQLRQADLEQSGFSRSEAAAASRRLLGNVTLAREEARDVWGASPIDHLARDLRYGLRQLTRTPGVTALMLTTLAIGIAANATVFAIINAEVFTYRDAYQRGPSALSRPDELRQILAHSQYVPGFFTRVDGQSRYFSHGTYRHLQEHSTRFSHLFCLITAWQASADTGGGVEEHSVSFLSGTAFQALGVTPTVGRPVTVDDDRADAPPVALLDYGFWERSLGADPSVVGRTVRVNDLPVSVIGVMPRGFLVDHSSGPTDIVAPVAQYPAISGDQRALADDESPCRIIGRLRSGQVEQQAVEETALLIRQAASVSSRASIGPDGSRVGQVHVALRHVGREIDALDARGFQNIAPMLMSIVLLLGLVLLITCTNLAGMLLARGAARRREIATRLAIGASRRRIVRQLLTESVVLAATGGILGVLLTAALERLAVATGMPFVLDARVVAITAGVSLLTGLVFGLAPAIVATRPDVLGLAQDGAGHSLAGEFRLGKVLVAVQVALSVPLLVCACLQVQRFLEVSAVRAGDAERVLLVQASQPRASVAHAQPDLAFDAASASLAAMPGVRSVTWLTGRRPDRASVCPTGRSALRVDVVGVSPGFFDAMGVPVLGGRSFMSEEARARGSVMVNEAFVREAKLDGAAVGASIGLSGGCAQPARLVGVVDTSTGDVPGSVVRLEATPTVYVPFPQVSGSARTFVLHTTARATLFIEPTRRALLAVDPSLTAGRVQSLSETLRPFVEGRRLLATAYVVLGLTALAQAIAGLYGTLACFVSRRTPEIGVRIALGARSVGVVSLVIRQSLLSVSIGVLAGIGLAPLAVRVIAARVSGATSLLSAADYVLLAALVSTLMMVAFLAASAPAWRAARINPLVALRHE